MNARRLLGIAVAGVLLAAGSAQAIIKVDVRMSDLYAKASQVLIGQVAAVKGTALTVKVTSSAKGSPPGPAIQVDLGSVAAADVAPGQPAVVLVGRAKGAAVHLADRWFQADAVSPTSFRLTREEGVTVSFPGRTATLARLMLDYQVGKAHFLQAVEHNVIGGGFKVLKVGPAPALLASADVNGDGKDEVLIGYADRVQLADVSGDAVVDLTAARGLAGASGDGAVFGDANGDGRPDLLLGSRWYENTGAAFAATGGPVALPPVGERLATALDDVTGDKKPDLLVLLASGDVQVYAGPAWQKVSTKSLWQGGEPAIAAHFSRDWGAEGEMCVMVVTRRQATRYALDGSEPPATFERLAGRSESYKPEADGLAAVFAMPIDINGDGLLDYIILRENQGGPMLVNRGYGMFMDNPDAAGHWQPSGRGRGPWPPYGRYTPTTKFVAADVYGDKFDDLVVATDKGDLVVKSNTPFPPHP